MGLFHSPKCRLLSMLCLTFFFFLVEIIVGYFTNSTALIADSFHMLSDVVALVIAYVSVRMSPKKWSKNTFGWARAEVLGALINAVFLMALCFSILIESFKRIVDPEKLHNPILILVVGIIGLVINLIGLGLFHEHGHSHSGHTHVPQQDDAIPVINSGASHSSGGKNNSVGAMIQNGDLLVGEGVGNNLKESDLHRKKKDKTTTRSTAVNMNMRGVFLHVLADALGSIIVIISALIVQYTDWEYNVYVDPALSIIMVIIIIHSTLPLLIDSALILLQTVPTHIQIDSLQRKLLEEIDGVLAVHEFHVWQLAGDRIIASAHIRCRNLHDYMEIAEKVKEFFHNEGIHSTTIQPEFVEPDDGISPGQISGPWSGIHPQSLTKSNPKSRWINDANCALDCPPGQLGRESCLKNTCCGPQQKRSPNSNYGLDEIEIQKAGSSGQVTRQRGRRSGNNLDDDGDNESKINVNQMPQPPLNQNQDFQMVNMIEKVSSNVDICGKNNPLNNNNNNNNTNNNKSFMSKASYSNLSHASTSSSSSAS